MGRLTRSVSLPAVIAMAGVAVVLYQWLGNRPLWLDEEMIAVNIRDRSFAALAGRLWLDQSAPLGWLALQRLVLLTLGSSELALRAVPALFGVATVLAAFFVGRRWLTGPGCAVLVLLCSFGEWISFYSVELKSYSADTFWGLSLPALAVAAAGDSSIESRRKNLAIWAMAAAIGHWFSLGALLVLPACVAVLAVSMRRNRESLRWAAAACSIVAMSFAIHYFLAIRYTQDSESLQRYWQFAMAPRDAGVSGTLRWLYSQLEPFALKPGGTGHESSFWILAGLGVAFASARLLGLAAGLVVLSGLALAAFRIMPLYERLSLWFLPALYLAIALFADRAIGFLRRTSLKHFSLRLAAAGLVVAILAGVCLDIVGRGISSLRQRPSDSNRDTNDRAAVTWLMQQRQPGDILITTAHAQPAIWWYGGVSLSLDGGLQFADGGRIFVAEYYESEPVCRGRELETAIDRRHRIQVYFGFVDTRPGFDDLLLERLSNSGTIAAVRHFGGLSRAAVIDTASTGWANLFWEDAGKDTGTWLKGCAAVGPARPW